MIFSKNPHLIRVYSDTTTTTDKKPQLKVKKTLVNASEINTATIVVISYHNNRAIIKTCNKKRPNKHTNSTQLEKNKHTDRNIDTILLTVITIVRTIAIIVLFIDEAVDSTCLNSFIKNRFVR